MFQFYAGDLYEVIPHVAEIYAAIEVVDGKCEGEKKGEIKIKTLGEDIFGSEVKYDC